MSLQKSHVTCLNNWQSVCHFFSEAQERFLPAKYLYIIYLLSVLPVLLLIGNSYFKYPEYDYDIFPKLEMMYSVTCNTSNLTPQEWSNMWLNRNDKCWKKSISCWQNYSPTLQNVTVEDMRLCIDKIYGINDEGCLWAFCCSESQWTQLLTILTNWEKHFSSSHRLVLRA